MYIYLYMYLSSCYIYIWIYIYLYKYINKYAYIYLPFFGGRCATLKGPAGRRATPLGRLKEKKERDIYIYMNIYIYVYILISMGKLPGSFFQAFSTCTCSASEQLRNTKKEKLDIFLMFFKIAALWTKPGKKLWGQISETLVSNWGGGPAKNL